jgi:outer membrane protein assembly factor BamB
MARQAETTLRAGLVRRAGLVLQTRQVGRRPGLALETRLLTLLTAIVLAGFSASPAAQQREPRPGDWPQFRGTRTLTGIASAPLPPASLKLLWSLDLKDMVDSSPAIAGGIAYIGTQNGLLVAVDMATGRERWRYETGGPIGIGESSPAVAGGAVYVGDLEGIVHAVNATDGKRLWTFKTGSEVKASPIVVNGLVVIGSYDTNLYALDAKTGAERWRVPTRGAVHATPAVQGDVLYLAGCDAVFRAIRVSDGRQLYEIPTGAYTGASPVIDGDRAYVGTFEYEVLALDLKARKVIWRYSDPDRQFPFYSSATVTQGKVILGGRDRTVHAIDAATGKRAWAFQTRARIDSSPAVAGDRVYIGSGDNRFYVLEAATGRKVWEFDTGSGITSSPAIAGGRVLIASTDGVLYCFG